MDRGDRLLYHQIHPAKLATDVATAAVAAALLWEHRLALALAIGFMPSIAVTAILVQWADLDRYRTSRFGRYVGRFMTRRVELARLAGLLPLWGGAWLRRSALMIVGVLWIVGCWLWGLRRSATHDSAV